jgi:hypothetical protein
MMRHASRDAALSGFSPCPARGLTPAEVDGFTAFAPKLAHAAGGFNAGDFAPLAALVKGHFWAQLMGSGITAGLRFCRPADTAGSRIRCRKQFQLPRTQRESRRRSRPRSASVFTPGSASKGAVGLLPADKKYAFPVVSAASMLGSRLFSRRRHHVYDPTAELRLPMAINAALYAVMRMETGLIRLGLDLPLGGSRLLVARKP